MESQWTCEGCVSQWTCEGWDGWSHSGHVRGGMGGVIVDM